MDIFDPIQQFANIATHSWLGLSPATYWADTINFFIYDVIKIGILLWIINYFMAITRHYFPMTKVQTILSKRRWYGLDYLFAAILGVITPFCSCSSIPLFIGFLGAGIPLGVTFAFLISSPLVNEASLAIFPAMFGLQTTLIYNLVGILVSVAGGMLISRLKLDRYVYTDLLQLSSANHHSLDTNSTSPSRLRLLKDWSRDAWGITKEVFPYVVFGVAVGALIHGFVPDALVAKYLSIDAWWTVPLAVILGVPLYANSVSIIPIIEAFTLKGIPLGTALAFMTATVTLSIPQALILKRVMAWQLLATFFGITLAGILAIGILFNAIV